MVKRHGVEVRRTAAELFGKGYGSDFVASRLGLSHIIVEQWLLTYRAVGSEVLLAMGTTHRKYDFGTKVAAASAVIDLGKSKPEVMVEFRIASKSPLNAWCSKYREGGAEALRLGRRAGPRPNQRRRRARRSSSARPWAIRGQVAYLKKSIALKVELSLLAGNGPRP